MEWNFVKYSMSHNRLQRFPFPVPYRLLQRLLLCREFLHQCNLSP